MVTQLYRMDGNMDKKYIIGIDQSTQGTKALLFDGEGHLLRRTDLPHRQIINEKGWVSHDLNEIYSNTVQTVKTLVTEAKSSRRKLPASASATRERRLPSGIGKRESHWNTPLCGSAAVRAVLHRKLPKKAVRKKFVKQPVCSFPRTSRQQRWHGC